MIHTLNNDQIIESRRLTPTRWAISVGAPFKACTKFTNNTWIMFCGFLLFVLSLFVLLLLMEKCGSGDWIC